MLGEQIYESRGKRTARRVVSVDGGFKVEVSLPLCPADGPVTAAASLIEPPDTPEIY